MKGMDREKRSFTLDRPTIYRICVQGELDQSWSEYLHGMAISSWLDQDQGPITVLTGELTDQAALLGILNSLYNLSLSLLCVDCLSNVKWRIALDDVSSAQYKEINKND